MATFSDRLKFLRKKHNYSQEELANKIGIGRASLANYETGRREPDFETLETIADFFNVDMDFLLGKSDIESSPLTEADGFTKEELQMFDILKQIKNVDHVSTIKVLYEDGHEKEIQLFRI